MHENVGLEFWATQLILAWGLLCLAASGSMPPKLVEQTTPQQQNSYDCGVYVIAIAQLLCNVFEDSHKCIPVQDVDILLRTQVTPSFVHKMRCNILELISQLVK